MSDRTYFQFNVAYCPADQMVALAAAIEKLQVLFPNRLTETSVPGDPNAACVNGEWLRLADDLTWDPESWDIHEEEAPCGLVCESEDAFAEIAAAAPGAVWQAWTDPRYEWEGQMAGYSPDTGLFFCPCDSTGRVTRTADQASAELRNELASGADADRLLAALWPDVALDACLERLRTQRTPASSEQELRYGRLVRPTFDRLGIAASLVAGETTAKVIVDLDDAARIAGLLASLSLAGN